MRGPEAPSTVHNTIMENETPNDYTMSMVKANVVGALAFPAAALAVIVPFMIMHGPISFRSRPGTIWIYIIAFLLSIVVHEALHAFGFIVFARAPRSSVHFGIDRKTLTPFAGCKTPVRATGYRIACLLPAIVLGAIPSGVALISGNGPLAIFGAFMIATAGGDFAAVIAMRKVPGEALVLDHPTRVGCRIAAH
jgi:hypothetical protein